HRSHGRSYLERSNPTGQRLASGYWQDEVMPAHAVIIGGGIAGLAAATALQNRSWHVTILEREPAPAEVGAGITLWPNALRALDALGIGSLIRSRGLTQAAGGIRSSRGRWPARPDAAGLAGRL